MFLRAFRVASVDEMNILSGAFGRSVLQLCRDGVYDSVAQPLNTPFRTFGVGLEAAKAAGKSTFIHGALNAILKQGDFSDDRHIIKFFEPYVDREPRVRLAWANAISQREQVQVRSWDNACMALRYHHSDSIFEKPYIPLNPKREMDGVDFIEHAYAGEYECTIQIHVEPDQSRRIRIVGPDFLFETPAIQDEFLPQVSHLETTMV